MNDQVDLLQALRVHLERRAVMLSAFVDVPLNQLLDAVEKVGARVTVISGEKWIVKNNSQRERVVADGRAMGWFLRNVVLSARPWTVSELRAAARADRYSWSSIKRIATQMGWYEVPTRGAYPGILALVGREMDPDTRIIVCRLLRSAADSGVDLESDLAWKMVSAGVVPGSVSVHDFELCVAIVRSDWYAGGEGVE